MRKSAKDPNILDKVREALLSRNYRYTEHAQEQMLARRINSKEVSYILAYGYHESRKDDFNSATGHWKYSIRARHWTVEICE